MQDIGIVLEGGLAIYATAGTVTADLGDIVYMPKGEAVTIITEGESALTPYITYQHWAKTHVKDKNAAATVGKKALTRSSA